MTALETGIEPELAELIGLADGDTVSVSIHGVLPNELYERLQNGTIDAIKRQVNSGEDSPYLVATAKVGHIDVTLFSVHLDKVRV